MPSKTLLLITALAWSLGPAALYSNTADDDDAEAPAPVAPLATPGAAPAPAVPVVTPVAPAAAPIAAPARPAAASVSLPAAAAAPLAPSVSGTAEAQAPAVSPTGSVLGVSDTVEAMEDDGQKPAEVKSPELNKLSSETLAAMAGEVVPDAALLMFDPTAKKAVVGAVPGTWQVPVDALYYELAARMLNDNKDKTARQAFAMALFKDADRAKFAKELAYDDKLADTVIKEIESGNSKARMDLQGLAEKGNRKARLYLGMDKPLARETAGEDTSTAETAPQAAALSPTAESAPQAAAVSPTASPAPEDLEPKAAVRRKP